MSGSIPIQIRGTPSNGPPVGLVERQLAVEMDTGNLWVGVPVSIDSTGRIMLNPRRTPAGGDQYDYLMRGAGTSLAWNALGNRAGNCTGGGWSALFRLGSGTNNTAWGNSALMNLTAGNYNVAVGNSTLWSAVGMNDSFNVAIGAGAAQYATTVGNSIFIGYNAAPASNAASYNEIVIGAATTGAGNNTVSFPSSTTQFHVGGRDLLAVGSLPPYAPAPGTLTAVPNDGAVHDVTSVFLSEGLWIILLQIWMTTSTATPWFYYAGGISTGPGQTTIDDPTEFATTAGTVTAANFRHLNMFPVPAPGGTLIAAVRAQNPTNSGTYNCHVVIDAVQLR